MPLNYTNIGRFSADIDALVAELSDASNEAEFRFTRDPRGQEILRQRLRLMHGYDPSVAPKAAYRAIGRCDNTQAPLYQLVRGRQDLYAVKATSIPGGLKYTSSPQESDDVLHVIRAVNIEFMQKNVSVYFDPSKISLEQVEDIQLLKAGRKAKHKPSNMRFHHYEKLLEQLGSYVVVRGEVRQLYLTDANATHLSVPPLKILYYANFPKLQGETSRDLHQFAYRTDKTWSLKSSQKELLKEKFKDVIRLQIQVAARYHEGVDIVTPNAFFYALNDVDQRIAKDLFAQAVAEIGCEQHPKDFKGLFVHDTDNMRKILLSSQYQGKYTIPIVLNPGIASSPQIAANNIGLSIDVPECIMGEVCGFAGNGALGARAFKGKEEGDTRECGGYVECIFGPQWNPKLLNTTLYQPLSSSKTTSALTRKPLDNSQTSSKSVTDSGLISSTESSSSENSSEPQVKLNRQITHLKTLLSELEGLAKSRLQREAARELKMKVLLLVSLYEAGRDATPTQVEIGLLRDAIIRILDKGEFFSIMHGNKMHSFKEIFNQNYSMKQVFLNIIACVLTFGVALVTGFVHQAKTGYFDTGIGFFRLQGPMNEKAKEVSHCVENLDAPKPNAL